MTLLAHRITFTSAFSAPTWAIAFLPSVSTAVLHDRNLFGGSALAWLTAALAGALAAGIVLAVAHRALGTRRPIALVLIVFAIAGIARGLGVGTSAWALGLVDDPQWLIRAMSGAVLAIFWLSVATIIVDGFRTHRETRVELAARENLVRAELQQTSRELTSLRARAERDIGVEVGQVVEALESLPIDDADAQSSVQRAAARLHDLSAGVVRPLSHEVALPGAVPDKRHASDGSASRAFALRAIIVDALTVDPFRPGWLMLVLFPSILMTAIRNYGVGLGILGAVWIVAMAAVVLWGAQFWITPRLARWPVIVRALTVLSVWAVSAVASAVPVAWSSTWGLGPDRAWAVFGVPLLAYVPVTCVGIAVATAISKAWALDEDARASRIAALDWQQARRQQELRVERQRFGRHLHGSVQSTLTAVALAIEVGVRRGTPLSELQRDALARLTPLVDAPSVTGPPPVSGELIDALDRIARVWSRLAAVTVTIREPAHVSLNMDIAAADSVLEITREGIANAIRHGHAQCVEVIVELLDTSALELTVRDDGRLTRSAQAGLGSSILDDLCLDWTRTGTPTGTVLRCRIPIRSAAPLGV